MLARETGLCLKLLQVLAARDGAWTPIPELAEQLDLSRAYAAKLCSRLKDAKYVHTRQGVTGGVALTEHALAASLLDLARDLGDAFVVAHCVLLRETCNPDDPCPMHASWSVLHGEILDRLRGIRAVATSTSRVAGSSPSSAPG